MKTWILIKHELRQTWLQFVVTTSGCLTFALIPSIPSDLPDFALIFAMQFAPMVVMAVVMQLFREFMTLPAQSPFKGALEFVFSMPIHRLRLLAVKWGLLLFYTAIVMLVFFIRRSPSPLMLLVAFYIWTIAMLFTALFFMLKSYPWWIFLPIAFLPMLAPTLVLVSGQYVGYYKTIETLAQQTSLHWPWFLLGLLALTVTVYFFSARKFVNSEVC